MKIAALVTASLLFLIFVFPRYRVFFPATAFTSEVQFGSEWLFVGSEPMDAPTVKKAILWETMLLEILAAFAAGGIVWAALSIKAENDRKRTSSTLPPPPSS